MATNPFESPLAEAPSIPNPTPEKIQARDGLVSVPRGTAFPNRCVKCNAQTDEWRLLHGVSWFPRWIFLLLLAGVVPFLFMMIFTRNASFRIGLCREHRRRRRNRQILSCLFLAVGVFGLGGSVLIRSGWVAVISFATIVGSLIALVYGTRVISAAAINDQAVVLKGLSNEFVRDLF